MLAAHGGGITTQAAVAFCGKMDNNFGPEQHMTCNEFVSKKDSVAYQLFMVQLQKRRNKSLRVTFPMKYSYFISVLLYGLSSQDIYCILPHTIVTCSMS